MGGEEERSMQRSGPVNPVDTQAKASKQVASRGGGKDDQKKRSKI